jgi:hypothetical protein
MADTPRMADTATGEVHDDDGPGELPFAAWFQDLGRGVAHADMTDELRKLVETVMLCRKKGAITLAITVEPPGSVDQVVVKWEITSKPPKQELPAAIFYVDGAHNLLREDPNALPLGTLREVPVEAAPTTAREVQP